MKKILILIIVFMPSWAMADQTDPRLPELFEELKMAEDAMQAGMIEIRIWDIWGEHPDPEIDALMAVAMDEMGGNQLHLAVQLFTEIIDI